MKQFEYKIVRGVLETDRLRSLGIQGFELVSSYIIYTDFGHPISVHHIFKKEL